MPTRSPAPLVLLLCLTLLAACAGTAVTDPTPRAAAGSGAAGSGDLMTESPASSDLVNLDVDACAFLDLATVQALTGVEEEYSTDSDSGPSESKCFWGATSPGVPGYVELQMFRQQSLSAYSFGDGCTVTPVEGVGAEAAFVECPPNPQTKISMLSFDRGVIVSILVNEPANPLTAEDLGPVITSVFEQLL